MPMIIATEDHPTTEDFLGVLNRLFASGDGFVYVATNGKVVGTMMSPDMVADILAKSIIQE